MPPFGTHYNFRSQTNQLITNKGSYSTPPQKLTKKRATTSSLSILPENYGRGGRIRTGDHLNPIQVRYLAALRPEVIAE